MSRIVAAAALLALAVAGCGGSARPGRTTAREIPRALGSSWASRASAVAAAAAKGDDCRALQLASSLRDDVIREQAKVPSRLRSQLVAGVNALADRIDCTVPPETVTVPPPKSKHAPPPKPPKHDHHHKPPPNKQGQK